MVYTQPVVSGLKEERQSQYKLGYPRKIIIPGIAGSTAEEGSYISWFILFS
jgi:hypothetical protein